MMEQWDLYDQNRCPLHRKHVRGMPMQPGEFHVVVNVLSVDRQGNILITKRHPKKPFGGKWEVTGGSVLAGETSLHGAVRELEEETGLHAAESELDYRGTIVQQASGCLHDWYCYQADFTAQDIRLQRGETIAFQIVSPQRLAQMTESGKFLDFVYQRLENLFPEQIIGAQEIRSNGSEARK